MKPTSSVASRLLDLQNSLEVDAHGVQDKDLRVIIEALALLAEGVAKTSRDVRELSQEVRGKTKKPAQRASPRPTVSGRA